MVMSTTARWSNARQFFQVQFFFEFFPLSNPRNKADHLAHHKVSLPKRRKPVNSCHRGWIARYQTWQTSSAGGVRRFESSFSDTAIVRKKRFRYPASQRPLQVFLSGSLEFWEARRMCKPPLAHARVHSLAAPPQPRSAWRARALHTVHARTRTYTPRATPIELRIIGAAR